MDTKNITISNSEKIGIISNLGTMLSAGISIIETIDALLEDAKGNQRKILSTLKVDLNQGNRMYTSFAKFPRVFDKVTINIIKASEEAGSLEVSLKDIKTNLQKDSEFNDKIKSALIYPMFITIVFVGVLLMILIVVIPKISTVFSRLNVVLPLPTKVLIFASNLLLQNTIPVLLVILILSAGGYFLFKRFGRYVTGFLVNLPLINELVKQIDMARFSRGLYLLLTAAIPITTALELTEDVVVRPDVKQVIREALKMVNAGHKLSEGLKKNKNIFTGIVLKMIEAGEKSGTLDKSMEEISEFMQYKVDKMLATLVALIEPIMLIFVGVMVGGMMLSIIAPIYSMIGQVGSK